MKVRVISKTLDDTQRLGLIISSKLFQGAVISLDGDLGAGKTTFTKSLSKGLNIKEEVSSPTFNILKCYFSGKLPLYHIDAYRLEDQINVDVGLEEVIEGDGVCVIEWGKFIEELIFEPLNIKISILENNVRQFDIESNYSKYQNIIDAIKEEFNV
jgi:tRNA threonylcarbamoyladenosine biosynthesis protein TsaE